MPDVTEEPKKVKWYHSKWGVLVILGTVGPLGLYVLWRSPEFNLFWKWALTLATLALTLFLILAAETLPLLVSQSLLLK